MRAARSNQSRSGLDVPDPPRLPHPLWLGENDNSDNLKQSVRNGFLHFVLHISAKLAGWVPSVASWLVFREPMLVMKCYSALTLSSQYS